MYNKKILSAIVAILAITAMLSTMTTVLATHTPEVSLAPTIVGKQARVLFTLVVKNTSGDGIDNIKIWIPTGFIELISGAENAENLKIAVDNLGVISDNLPIAGENLKQAGTDVKATGSKLVSGADLLSAAGAYMIAADSATASRLQVAGLYIKKAGENLSVEPADVGYVSAQLKSAAALLKLVENNYTNENENKAAENLRIAGSALENAADNLIVGKLVTAVSEFLKFDNAIDNAGINYGLSSRPDVKLAGPVLRSAASYFSGARSSLDSAKGRIQAAGAVLQSLYPKWENVVSAIGNATLSTASGWLDKVSENLKVAGDNLYNANDNIFLAGVALENAGLNLENAATDLGTYLGKDGFKDASGNIKTAGKGLSIGSLNLTSAGGALVSAASNIASAKSKLSTAASSITVPSGWKWVSGDNRFEGIGDNVIPAGESRAYSFILKTPSSSGDYTFTVRTEDKNNAWVVKTITVTVDATPPTYTIKVSQTGVPEDGKVGKVYQGGKATVTITASEPLASLASHLNVDNDNTSLTLTPDAAKKVWTAEFTVGNWDDNDTLIVVTSAVDLAGNENSDLTEKAFIVDTRAPYLSSLSAIDNRYKIENFRGTGGRVWVDNVATKLVSGVVTENGAGSGIYKAYVIVNQKSYEASLDPSNNFAVNITLDEGFNALKVKVVDKVGNYYENVLENFFLDTKKPTIGIVSPADKAEISDNKPTIKVKILDPGYPDSGLGVKKENIKVKLSITGWENILENAIPWDPASGIFENKFDNQGAGLVDGLYTVEVWANDNLNDNSYLKWTFKVDTHAPVWSVAPAENPLRDTTSASPKLLTVSTLPITGSNVSEEDKGATVKVYVNGVEQTAARTTVDSNGRFTTNVALPARTVAKIEVTLTDKAGNESGRVLYGYAIYKPTLPTPSAAENPLKDTSYTSPLVVRVTSIPISGSGVEIGATIKVYVNDKVAVSVVADAYGRWSANVPITAGEVNKVEVTVSDRAGNESDRVLYGYVMTDKSAPKVTISAPAAGTTTDKATIAVSGKVTKDAWETYDEIRVSAQVGLTSAPVPVASDGSFAVNVPLAEGANTIIVSAEDAAGNRDSASVTVERTVTPWGTYAIVLVVIALVLAAIAIFRKR